MCALLYIVGFLQKTNTLFRSEENLKTLNTASSCHILICEEIAVLTCSHYYLNKLYGHELWCTRDTIKG